MAEGRQSAPPQARIDKGRKLRPHQVGLHLLDGLVWDGKTELLFGSCEAEPELPPCPEAGLRAGTLTRQSLHSTANAFAMLCCAMLALAASTHGIREEARHLLARIARAEPVWVGRTGLEHQCRAPRVQQQHSIALSVSSRCLVAVHCVCMCMWMSGKDEEKHHTIHTGGPSSTCLPVLIFQTPTHRQSSNDVHCISERERERQRAWPPRDTTSQASTSPSMPWAGRGTTSSQLREAEALAGRA